MDTDIKDMLQNIQTEIVQINNKIEKLQKIAANGNYALIDWDKEDNKNRE